MTTIISHTEPDQLVHLIGVNFVERGQGPPVLQVRVGDRFRGAFLEGTLPAMREIAGDLGLSAIHYPDDMTILFRLGRREFQGTAEEVRALGAQIGTVCAQVEQEHRPMDPFVNLGVNL